MHHGEAICYIHARRQVKKHEIQLLYRYNAWANARFLDAAGGLTDEQFTAPASFPFGGVRGILVHTMSAEMDNHAARAQSRDTAPF